MKNSIRCFMVAFTLLPLSIMAQTLTGTVTNSAGGAPIANALVVLRQGGAATPILDSARTDATGTYTITGLAAATNYRVTASATNFTAATVTPDTVTATGTTTTNFALVAFVPGTITGTVTDSVTGSPLANALVVLRQGGAATAILDSARTDATGTYTISGLAPAVNYRITASAAVGGYSAKTVTPDTVTSGGTTTTVFALAPGGEITGTVSDSISNAVIANALVVLRLGAATTPILDSVRTDSTGSYTISGLTPGTTYRLTVTATNYNAKTVTPDTVISSTQTVIAVALAPIVPGTLTGTMTDSVSGAVIANALVVVRQGAATTAILDSVRTSATGTYTISGLVPAVNYRITASATGYAAKTTTPDTVTAGGTTTTNFALAATGTITGTVTNAAGGAVVANALVVLRLGAATTAILDSVRTSATGTYTITGLTAATTYRVTVSAPGFVTATATPDSVIVGGTTTTNFALVVSTGNILGTVTLGSATGPAVANALVVLTSTATGAFVDSVRTNTDGAYVFINVVSGVGSYTITVTAPAGTATSTGVAVTTAGTSTYNIVLIPSSLRQVTSNSQGIRFSSIGNQLALDLGVSNIARTVTVYSLNGVIGNQTSVPAGVSRVVLPAAFAPANGFLFQVK